MRLHQLSDRALRIEEGSIYPALYRMEEQGLIESERAATENNCRAKFARRAARIEPLVALSQE